MPRQKSSGRDNYHGKPASPLRRPLAAHSLYDEVMAKATEAIKLKDLNIPSVKTKWAITGAIALEV